MTHIRDTGYALVLKLASIKSLDGLLEIGGSLKLHKANEEGSDQDLQTEKRTSVEGLHSPFAVGVATGLRVDDITARLTGEIFQVLRPENPRKLKSRFEHGVG